MSFKSWFRDKITVKNGQPLDIKHIFLLPNKSGVIYIFVCIGMLIFGVNYENNLVLLVGLFGLSALVSSIFITYRNLHGLTIRILEQNAEFYADDAIALPIHLQHKSGHRTANLCLNTTHGPALFIVDVANIDTNAIILSPMTRGYHEVPLIYISADFPLGLFKAFSYLQPNITILVYPRPMSCEYLLTKQTKCNHSVDVTDDQHYTSSLARGYDEISGLKPYQMGDSLHLIDWRQVAKKRGLLVKDFSADQNVAVFLTTNSIRAKEYEEQIRQLTYAVIDLTLRDMRFGFEFNNFYAKVDSGKDHKQKILTYLATV